MFVSFHDREVGVGLYDVVHSVHSVYLYEVIFCSRAKVWVGSIIVGKHSSVSWPWRSFYLAAWCLTPRDPLPSVWK